MHISIALSCRSGEYCCDSHYHVTIVNWPFCFVFVWELLNCIAGFIGASLHIWFDNAGHLNSIRLMLVKIVSLLLLFLIHSHGQFEFQMLTPTTDLPLLFVRAHMQHSIRRFFSQQRNSRFIILFSFSLLLWILFWFIFVAIVYSRDIQLVFN